MQSAIYPGSFDPLTSGHLDLIERGAVLFELLIVAVLQNPAKAAVFTVAERMEMLREATRHLPNVEVDSFDGLLVRYAESKRATVVLRGIRAVSDYEYELPMAHMNHRLAPGVETVFLMAREAHSFISSRLVKEVSRLGGDVRGLTPDFVEARLRQKRDS
jgi:pantetheine-phosphate adenylyltransferase